MSLKQWKFSEADRELAASLSETCGLAPMLCFLLTGRGVTTPEEAAAFLTESELQGDPFAYADMDAAVDRVQRALDDGEPIAVFGDYDADGVTATVLLYSYLRDHGANVRYHLPRRDGEGYGLHNESIDAMADAGVTLIITVDNGIAANDEVDYAAERGIDVVITDHHRPPEKLPHAVAVVNPHRADCEGGFRDFAGVGVAFLLVAALEGDTDSVLESYGDLVAIGTLADVMPLVGDNRVLVRRGLAVLSRGRRAGLTALRRVAGVLERPTTASTVSFSLAPRINAAGRMDDPDLAAQLLLADNEEEATALAAEIQTLNAERQDTEARILGYLTEELDRDPAPLAERVIVICGTGWHPGVRGIIAARVQERYGKPCIVLSKDSDGMARGSGRSLPGFSLYEALCACDDCLLGYGGHELAAGVTLEFGRVEEFRRRINDYAAQCEDMPVPQLHIDCRLKPSQLSVELVDSLSALEPVGSGNPAPLFALCRLTLERIEPVGNGRHLRLTLSRDGTRITAMRFGMTAEQIPYVTGDTVDLAVTLDRNEYKGSVGVSVIIRDMRFSDGDREEVLSACRLRDAVLRRETAARRAMPSRDCTARVYRFLRSAPFSGSPEVLHHRLKTESVSAEDILLSLQLLREAQLITVLDRGDTLEAAVCEGAPRADLSATPTARFLEGV